MGELIIDLREADTTGTPLEIDLGVGQASLVVPDDVCMATWGHQRRRGAVPAPTTGAWLRFGTPRTPRRTQTGWWWTPWV